MSLNPRKQKEANTHNPKLKKGKHTKRNYRQSFIIICEGQTEQDYFAAFSSMNPKLNVYTKVEQIGNDYSFQGAVENWAEGNNK